MRETAIFLSELFDFLRELKRHNNRKWFANNKELYQRVVVEPALLLVTRFAPHLAEISPHFVANPHPTRGSLFRIYRDIRFSLDKRPFKTHVGIRFAHEAGKGTHAPVFYLHLEPDNCFAAAGVWHPENRVLTKIRTAIVTRPDEWAKVRRELELEGDTLTRPPKGFDPKHPFIEDLKHKDFVASAAFSDTQVCSPKFIKAFAAECRALSPLVAFTTTALGLEF